VIPLAKRPTHCSFDVLGVRVDAFQIPEVIEQMEFWIQRRAAGYYIAVTGMHGVMEAHHDPIFSGILNAADLIVPDGMPLVWLGRARGFDIRRRVYGPELMLEFCAQTAVKGYRHFFYGGAPGVAEQLAQSLRARFPQLCVAGAYSPPFRNLTLAEDREIAKRIRAAAPDVLWVGLSTPKQEHWMHTHRDRVGVPVLVGVGAAFDIHAGIKKQAPRWMRESGLEWLFRLAQEPRRLWRRYLLFGSEFVWNVSRELLRVRNRE
jgi:N-acetylglucosaminyldiphosphoundecaprenol N-acetyl-beta-D-mannosaminyltransferase